jgi:hypothetical protein
MPAFEYCATVKIVDSFTILATVDIQVAALGLAKEQGTRAVCSTARAFQPVRMEVVFYPLDTRLAIHQGYDWEIHATYFTQSLVLNMSLMVFTAV